MTQQRPWHHRVGPARRQLTLAERHYERALDFYTKGRLDDALADMDAAIAQAPRQAEFYAARGLILLQHGFSDDAELDLAQSLKLDVTQWLAHYGRGMAAFQQGDYAVSVTHFSRAQRIAPDRHEIYFHRAVAFHQMGRADEALRDMTFAQSLLESKSRRHQQAEQWLIVFRSAAPSGPPPSS